jgi:integrase
MLYLAVDSGMRPQEYLVLPHSALKDTGVEVDRALEGGGTEITVTKTRAGRRFIDLSPETLDMVRHYADHHAVENAHDLVFSTSNVTDSGKACETGDAAALTEYVKKPVW